MKQPFKRRREKPKNSKPLCNFFPLPFSLIVPWIPSSALHPSPPPLNPFTSLLPQLRLLLLLPHPLSLPLFSLFSSSSQTQSLFHIPSPKTPQRNLRLSDFLFSFSRRGCRRRFLLPTFDRLSDGGLERGARIRLERCGRFSKGAWRLTGEREELTNDESVSRRGGGGSGRGGRSGWVEEEDEGWKEDGESSSFFWWERDE